MVIARSEQVESELDAMIRRRDEKRRETEGERLTHELWQESVEREEAKDQSRRTWEWIRFHEDQAARHRRTLEGLIAHHETEAARLMEPEPKGETA